MAKAAASTTLDGETWPPQGVCTLNGGTWPPQCVSRNPRASTRRGKATVGARAQYVKQHVNIEAATLSHCINKHTHGHKFDMCNYSDSV